jgi:hypothetical protein
MNHDLYCQYLCLPNMARVLAYSVGDCYGDCVLYGTPHRYVVHNTPGWVEVEDE